MKRFVLWLLVPLLPVIGLTTGFMLAPENKPSWHLVITGNPFKADDAFIVLGHVNNGTTLLVAELTLQETQPSLIGIDITSGREQFRYVLTNDLLPARDPLILDAIMSVDGKHLFLAVRPDVYTSHRQIVMFDWSTRQVTKRFSLNTTDFIRSTHQSVNLLAGETNNGLTLWNLDQPDAPTNIPFHGTITSDASIVYREHSRIPSNWTGGVKGVLSVLELYDIKKRMRLKSILAEMNIVNVNWSSESQSFTAILDDSARQSLVSRQFIRVNDEFVEVPENDLVFNMEGTAAIDQHFLVIISSVKKGTWRRRIDQFLGTSVNTMLNRIWPDAQTLNLFDRSNTRLMHKLTIPIDHKPRSNPKINCHPQGQGVALWNSRSITYWDLYPTSRWYPRLAVLLGGLLATLLAWRLVRRQPKQLNHSSSR